MVIEAAELLQKALFAPVQCLENIASKPTPREWDYDGPANTLSRRSSPAELGEAFKVLLFAAARFQGSLYHQKHAFYFRRVKQWVVRLWVSSVAIALTPY